MARRLKRSLAVHLHHFVDDAAVEHVRHEARADTLDLVRPGAPPDSTGDSSGSTAMTFRLGLAWLARLQNLGDAGNRAPCPDAGNDDVHRRRRVVPDFLGRPWCACEPRDWPDSRIAAA